MVASKVIDVFLGFALGYTFTGTVDHFFITPKPVREMVFRLEELSNSHPEILSRNLPQKSDDVNVNAKVRFEVVRNKWFQTEWDGTIADRQATVSCRVILCRDSDKEEMLLVGRMIKEIVIPFSNEEISLARILNLKKISWKPVFISLTTKDNKDIPIYNLFTDPKLMHPRSKRKPTRASINQG